MNILKSLLIVLAIGGSTLYAESAKVVYDLTSGDIVKIKKHLIKSVNAVADYYKDEKKEFNAIVVISGDAYKYFVEDLNDSPYNKSTELKQLQPELKILFAELQRSKHVTFNMCATGMRARKIKKETIYKFVNAEMMKSIYLINAQNDGYAYMPIH
jgi:intracellular sulfur oxidation DsrE/DsrF family protein